MDYQDATDFVETFKTHRTGLVGYQLSQRQVEERNEKLALVKGLLWRGGKYEKMWHKFNTQYSHLQLFPHGSAMGPNTVAIAMDNLFTEFFGTRPKTRREKFNDAIASVYNLDVRPRADKVDIVNILIGLRDSREENV